MTLFQALALLFGGLLAGAFAVRAVSPGRRTALVAATGLVSTIALAGALIVALEATMPIVQIAGLAATLVGAIALAGGFTALVQNDQDPHA